MANLREKSVAPDFTLLDTNGAKVNLSDFLGKWVVLYFYPKDNTSGCTIEATSFSRLKDEFAKNNAVILGVSKDSCESHQKFTKNHNLTITLLSDPEVEVHKKYGAWRIKKFMGKEILGTVRSTFLIDKKGKIVRIWDNVNARGHAEEVLEALKK